MYERIYDHFSNLYILCEVESPEPFETLTHVMLGTGIPKALQTNPAIWVWLTTSSSGSAVTLGGSKSVNNAEGKAFIIANIHTVNKNIVDVITYSKSF